MLDHQADFNLFSIPNPGYSANRMTPNCPINASFYLPCLYLLLLFAIVADPRLPRCPQHLHNSPGLVTGPGNKLIVSENPTKSVHLRGGAQTFKGLHFH